MHGLVGPSQVKERFRQINHFEKLLRESGTTIVKLFLNISKGEQLARFKDRLNDPGKQWKISEADYKERAHWADYQRAYEDALSACSTKEAPWYAIPSDHKWFRDVAASCILAVTLEAMKIAVPKPRVDLEEIRKLYEKEARRAGRK